MSLLWVAAVLGGHDFGEPSEEYVAQIKHDYLRSHYDDPEYNDPDVVANKRLHDHYDAQGSYPARCRTDAQHCTHPRTDQKMRGIAQQAWDVSHRKMFYPEEHQQAQEESRKRLDGFLGDYALDHPDRVFPWHQDGTLGEPDDPRLKGS